MISSPVSISRCVHIHYKLYVVIMPQLVLVRGPQDSENVDKNLESFIPVFMCLLYMPDFAEHKSL